MFINTVPFMAKAFTEIEKEQFILFGVTTRIFNLCGIKLRDKTFEDNT